MEGTSNKGVIRFDKKFGLIILVFLVFAIVTACSGNENGESSGNPSSGSTAGIPATQKNPKSANWEVTSKVHYTEGTITEIHQSGEYADAITIVVETGYPSDNDPLEKSFFEPGTKVTFELLTMVHVSQFQLETGKKVIINSSQFTPKDSETPLWGADIIGYDRDGVYLNLTGKPANFTMSEQASLEDGKLVVENKK